MQAHFRATMEAYFGEMSRVSFKLLEAFSQALGLPLDTMHHMFQVGGRSCSGGSSARSSSVVARGCRMPCLCLLVEPCGKHDWGGGTGGLHARGGGLPLDTMHHPLVVGGWVGTDQGGAWLFSAPRRLGAPQMGMCLIRC